MTDEDQPSPGRLARSALLWAAGLVVAIKVLAHLLDPDFYFYIGDSNEYLKTAGEGYFPPGRSWLYGRLVRWLSFGSLGVLVWVQTAACLATALALGWMSVRMLGAPPWFGVAAAGGTAMGPFQLLYERTVLTEALGILAFTLFLGVILYYLRSRKALWLVAATLLGLLCVALRLAFLPVVLVLAVALPLLAWFGKPGIPWVRWARGLGFALGLSLSVLFLSHSAYRHLTGKLHNDFRAGTGEPSDAPPAYQYEDGWYLLGAASVALKPRHAPDAEMREIITAVPFPLDRAHRTKQMWHPEGLRALGYAKFKFHGNGRARHTALRVFLAEPLAILRNSLENLRVYWSAKGRDLALKEDLNTMFYAEDPGAMSQEFVDRVRDDWGADLVAVAGRRTVVKRWYMAVAPWAARALIIFPAGALVALVLFWRHLLWRRELVLLLTIMFIYLGVLLTLSLVESFRLVFPLEPLAVLALAAFIGRDAPAATATVGLLLVDPAAEAEAEANAEAAAPTRLADG